MFGYEDELQEKIDRLEYALSICQIKLERAKAALRQIKQDYDYDGLPENIRANISERFNHPKAIANAALKEIAD